MLNLLIPGVMLAGSGIQALGQIRGANAQKEAAERQLALKRMQADEIINRSIINQAILRRRGLAEIERYSASIVGTSGGGGGTVGAELALFADLQEQLGFMNHEALFKARMLREGADIEMDLASDAATASYIGAGGTVLSGLAGAAGAYYGLKKGAPVSLNSSVTNNYTYGSSGSSSPWRLGDWKF